MSWLVTAAQKIDPDAAVYLSRVEAADGQTLESGVRTAVEQFIVGCKVDGIWNAIKASCILAGARTLSGALVPLVGVAPTNVGGNFVSGDYNRKTGLLGNGGNKQLNSNRLVTVDPENNNHISIFASTVDTFSGPPNNFYMGAIGNNNRALGRAVLANAHTVVADTGSTAGPIGPTPPSNGFFGLSSQSSTTVVRTASTSTNITTDRVPCSGNIFVFSRNADRPVNARLAFYSIGEALDIVKLDTRATTLINALAAAIP